MCIGRHCMKPCSDKLKGLEGIEDGAREDLQEDYSKGESGWRLTC